MMLMTSHGKRSSRCLTCSVYLTTLKTLDCGHKFCTKCLISAHTDYILGRAVSETPWPCPEKFPCQVCGCMSVEPELRIPVSVLDGITWSGVSNTRQQRVYEYNEAAEAGDTIDYDNALWKMTDIRERDKNQVRLLWHNEEHPYIRQVAFLSDASVLYISRQHSAVHTLSLSGKPTKPPLQLSCVSPVGLCASGDGKALAIVDRVDSAESKLFVCRSCRDTWTVTELPSLRNLESICMSNDCRTFMGNIRWDKIVKLDQDGRGIWEKCFTGGGTQRSFMDMDRHGRVIISNPNSGLVTLLDAHGHVIKEFPQEYIKQPRGVCFTSRGHVMLADKEGRDEKDDRTCVHQPTVSLFSADGTYNRCVIKLEASPLHIVLCRDQYLAVATQSQGLYLYSI